MKHNVGSRQAAKLAREKFGERAFVARSGRLFQVNILKSRFGGMSLIYTKGTGKSWAQALTAAGIELPVDKPLPGTPSMDADMEHGEVEE